MKKSLKLILALFLMLSAWSLPTSVHANEEVGQDVDYILPTGGLQTPPEPIVDERELPQNPNAHVYSRTASYTEAELYQELENRIKEALLTGKTSIDIDDLQIDRSLYNINSLIYFSPYLSNGIDIACYYSLSVNQYTMIKITNSMTPTQTKAYIASVDAELDEILSQINSTMSDEQKALVIHDYLVYEYEYDYDNLTAGTLPEDSYRSGGLIMNRTGVCQAYAYAFYYLMSKFNIECYVTSSDSMNHAWNIIKIQDAYYHVDCTFDDPVRDRLGQVEHNYFLCSDTVIQDENHEHNGWNLTNLKCDSDKYDNAYWINVNSKICFDGETAYYLRSNADSYGGTIIARNNNKETSLSVNLGEWPVFNQPGYFYNGAFSGLYLKDKALYYNTATQIRKYSLTNGTDELVATPNTSNGNIYGSRVRNNGIQYVIKQTPNEQGTKSSTGSYGTYKLQYILNGGKNAEHNPTSYASDQATIILRNPTRNGYIFAGWYSDSSYSTKITQITKGSSGNKTVYAKWNSTAYKITYQLNGGTNNSANPLTYTNSSPTISLKSPIRKGYTFAGWYSDSTYKSKVTSIVQGSSGNKTLYAKWTPTTYKITYNLNGGKNSTGNRSSFTITTATFALKNPTRSGYTFNGWYSDSKYTKKVTSIAKGSIGNKTLYAKWTPTSYKITYNLNGGKNSSGNRSSYTIVTASFALKNPTRTGYTFKGWYSDSKFTKRVTSIAKGSIGNKTLYAKWSANTYKIRYNPNGATAGKMTDTSCKYGSNCTLRSNAFQKKGYSFLGWSTSKSGNVVYKNKATVKNLVSSSNAVKTLFAKWKLNTYKITYQLNGGIQNKSNIASYKVTSTTFTLKSPTKKGYVFKGWYSDKAFKNRVTKITKGSTGNKTLYAKWVKK
ncbi:hypothetical protein D5266_02480 [bacterium c-19]|nr:hypothetical protein [bacterium c-19]